MVVKHLSSILNIVSVHLILQAPDQCVWPAAAPTVVTAVASNEPQYAIWRDRKCEYRKDLQSDSICSKPKTGEHIVCFLTRLAVYFVVWA